MENQSGAAAETVENQPQSITRKQSTLPKPPGNGRALTEEEFETYIGGFTERDWAHCTIYAYQWWPVQKAKPHGENYVTKFNEYFKLEDFKETYCSGDWRFVVNDTDRPKKEQTVCTLLMKYRDPERPPKVNMASLAIHDPLNRDLVQQYLREGKLMETADGQISLPPHPKEQGDTTAHMLTTELLRYIREDRNAKSKGHDGPDALAEAIKIMSTASQESIKFALASVKQQEPDAFVKMFIDLQKLITPAKSADETKSPMIEFLMQRFNAIEAELREERKANRELITKLAERKPEGGGGTLLEQLDTALKVQEIMGGRGDGTPRNWKEWGMQALAQNSSQLGDLITAFAGRLRSAPAPRRTATATNGQTTDRTLPAGAADNGQSTDQPAPSNQPRTPLQDVQEVLYNYGRYLMNAFDKDVPGSDFAQAIIDMFGRTEYTKLANYGRELWLEAIGSIPELKQHFTGTEPQLVEFIEDFLAVNQPDTEEEPAEPPPAARTRKTAGQRKAEAARA